MNSKGDMHNFTMKAVYLDYSSGHITAVKQHIPSAPLHIFTLEFLHEESVCSAYLTAKR